MYVHGFPLRAERIGVEKLDKSGRELFQTILADQVGGPGAIPVRGGLDQLADSGFYFGFMNRVQLLMFNRWRLLLMRGENSKKEREDAANKPIHSQSHPSNPEFLVDRDAMFAAVTDVVVDEPEDVERLNQ